MTTLSTTFFHGIRPGDWKTHPRSMPGPVTTAPETRTSPDEGCSRPARIFITVLLPHPDGPITDTNSCGATSKSTSARAAVSDTWRPTVRLYVFERPLTS